MTRRYSKDEVNNEERLESFTMYAVCIIFIAFGVVMLAASIIGVYALLLWVIGG